MSRPAKASGKWGGKRLPRRRSNRGRLSTSRYFYLCKLLCVYKTQLRTLIRLGMHSVRFETQESVSQIFESFEKGSLGRPRQPSTSLWRFADPATYWSNSPCTSPADDIRASNGAISPMITGMHWWFRGNCRSPFMAAHRPARQAGKQKVDNQLLLALPTEPAGSGFVVIPFFSALIRPESFTVPVVRSIMPPVSHHIGTTPRVTIA